MFLRASAKPLHSQLGHLAEMQAVSNSSMKQYEHSMYFLIPHEPDHRKRNSERSSLEPFRPGGSQQIDQFE